MNNFRYFHCIRIDQSNHVLSWIIPGLLRAISAEALGTRLVRSPQAASYPGAMCRSMACVALAWAAWINLIDFVVRRLAESVSISGADCDFWSGLNKLDF